MTGFWLAIVATVALWVVALGYPRDTSAVGEWRSMAIVLSGALRAGIGVVGTLAIWLVYFAVN